MWADATRGDRVWMNAHLSETFTEFGWSGRRYTRSDILDQEIGPIDVELSDVSVRSVGTRCRPRDVSERRGGAVSATGRRCGFATADGGCSTSTRERRRPDRRLTGAPLGGGPDATRQSSPSKAAGYDHGAAQRVVVRVVGAEQHHLRRSDGSPVRERQGDAVVTRRHEPEPRVVRRVSLRARRAVRHVDRRSPWPSARGRGRCLDAAQRATLRVERA